MEISPQIVVMVLGFGEWGFGKGSEIGNGVLDSCGVEA